ncbi:ABC transporter ATP-binding protein [Bradyrhizobium sp. LMG 9283]|uniref:ABC transporter ATP-binding protein n=1 Tax=Bradyrhizobium sp. LMG 9283 TaxID=592064 RepID=UPI00388FD753
MTDALAVANLSSGFGGSMVLRDISLRIPSGGILALLGKNGMGKTTLLRTIMGFVSPRAGQIHVAGQDIGAMAPHHRRRLDIAYAPQEQALFQDLTVLDNLRLGLRSDGEFEAALETAAAAFPFLKSRMRQRAGTLSGGEQKMLIVARGLMARPKLFLLDEVTEGLQPSVVERLANALAEMRRTQGTALLVVEQHISFALGLADRYAVLERGEIVAEDTANAAAFDDVERHMRL